MKAKQPTDPEVSLGRGFSLETAREKVIVSIWAPVAKSLFSSPGDVLRRSSSLQQIKRECH